MIDGTKRKKSSVSIKYKLLQSSLILMELIAVQLIYASFPQQNKTNVGHSSPIIKFNSTTVDAGLVKPGDKAQGVFIVENQGDADLVIENVSPT